MDRVHGDACTCPTCHASDDDIRHAIDHALSISDLANTVDDTEAVLVLGPDLSGNPLEVGARDTESVWVSAAFRATILPLSGRT